MYKPPGQTSFVRNDAPIWLLVFMRPADSAAAKPHGYELRIHLVGAMGSHAGQLSRRFLVPALCGPYCNKLNRGRFIGQINMMYKLY
jgi:hypothetical protein